MVFKPSKHKSLVMSIMAVIMAYFPTFSTGEVESPGTKQGRIEQYGMPSRPSPFQMEPHFRIDQTSGENESVIWKGAWAEGSCFAVNTRGNLAIYGNGGYFQIADIKDEKNPEKLGKLLMPAPIEDIAIRGNLAFVAVGVWGVKIVDFSHSMHPREIGSFNTSGNARSIAIQNDLMAVSLGEAGFQLIDISDPMAPFEVGCLAGYVDNLDIEGTYLYAAKRVYGLMVYDISRLPDIVEVGSYFDNQLIADVIVRDGYAYLGRIWQGIVVLDVSDPQDLVVAGSLAVGDGERIALQGNYLYFVNEDYYYWIYDISDPADIHLLGQCDIGRWAGYDISASPRMAVVAMGGYGLGLFDTSDPENPIKVGGLDSGGTLEKICFEDDIVVGCGFRGGVNIVNVEASQFPKFLSNIDVMDPAAVSIQNGYLFVVDRSLKRLSIYNVDNPVNPELCSEIYFDEYLKGSVLGDNYIFVTYGSGFYVVDVSDPGNPNVAGIYDGSADPYGVDYEDGFVYLATLNAGLKIIDVRVPYSPKFRTNFLLGNQLNSVNVVNGYAYCIGYPWESGAFGALQIIDVRNLLDPEFVGEYVFYENPGSYYRNQRPQSVYVKDNLAYVAGGILGLRMFDVSGLDAPVPLGAYDTGGNAYSVAADDDIYVADGDMGLVVLETNTDVGNWELEAVVHGSPIEIPSIGGWFEYDLIVYNEFSEDRLAKFQLDVVLPNGGVAHLPDSALVNIGAGQELEITGIRQVVPGKAPHGEYTYRIFVSSENGGYRVLESIPFYKSQDKSMESAGGSWATLGLSAEISPEGSNWGEDRSQPFHGVSPNPLNSAGTIWFELSRQSNLKLQVFDVSGRLVRTLIAGENREAGVHRVSWNGRDDKGRPVATGIYFYRLESGGMSQTGRMVFVK